MAEIYDIERAHAESHTYPGLYNTRVAQELLEHRGRLLDEIRVLKEELRQERARRLDVEMYYTKELVKAFDARRRDNVLADEALTKVGALDDVRALQAARSI